MQKMSLKTQQKVSNNIHHQGCTIHARVNTDVTGGSNPKVKDVSEKEKKPEVGITSWIIGKGKSVIKNVAEKITGKPSKSMTTSYSTKKCIGPLTAQRGSSTRKCVTHLVRHITVKSDPSIALKIYNSNNQSEHKVHLFMRLV